MDRSELVTCAAMQCEVAGKPMHILTLLKFEANVDTPTSYFELDNYLFLLITSSSAKMEILCRLGLNETLFDN